MIGEAVDAAFTGAAHSWKNDHESQNVSATFLPVMWLAGLGFVLSLIAHVFAVAGVTLPGGRAVFALHAGIFLVWFPTVFVMMRVTRGVARRDVWKVALSGCPRWMKRMLWGTFGYALLNFVLFAATTGGARSAHGDAAAPSVIRGFSGHWLVFYGLAFAVIHSVRNRPSLLRERRCSALHVVSPTADYCETCGERLSDPETANP